MHYFVFYSQAAEEILFEPFKILKGPGHMKRSMGLKSVSLPFRPCLCVWMCVFLRLAAQTEDPTVLLELLRALKGVGGGGGGGGRGETGSGGVFWVGKLWVSELKGNQEESAGLSTGSLFSSDPVLHPAASHPRLSLCEDPDLPCLPPVPLPLLSHWL